jgi:hypothetical protein
MKLTDINDRENCVATHTSAYFRNLSRPEQEKVLRAYFRKIRSLEQPVSEIDILICQVEAGIASPDPYEGCPRRDVK